MKKKIIKDGTRYKYLPITQTAKLCKLKRQALRFWIENGCDNKGRPIRAFMLEGLIFVSNFHAT